MSPGANKFSDEFLNAYIDNELADEDRQRLIVAMRDDESLGQRLCRLRTTRDLVQLGYHTPPAARTRRHEPARSWGWHRGVAALVLLGLGLGTGWFSHSNLRHGQSLMDIARTVEVSQADQASRQPVRIMLHVTTDDRFKLATVLDEAEQLLAGRNEHARPVEVAILANGDGLDLLRADQSPFAARIEAMKARYENLSLLACGKALQRVKSRGGVSPPLLPRTEVVPSALGEIINRRQDGWSYIMI